MDPNTLISEIPSVELQVLNEIGAYIAAKVSEQTVSMVAQDISTGQEPSWLSNLNPFDGGKAAHELQLHVTAMSVSAFQVAVLDAESNRIDCDLSQQVLSMLREFAS